MPSRKVNRGKIQFESPHYRVYQNQPYTLYIAKDAPIPDILVRDSSFTLDAKKYVPYKYRHPFATEDNDCLRFAEALAKGVVRYTSKACVYNVKDAQRKFGFKDQNNAELALKYRKDETANPHKDQAFAIVRTNLISELKKLKEEEELAPYHIAYVIVEDGDWRITLEANAAIKDLTKPEFGIYSTTDPTKSFHEMYKHMFGNKAAATIVLEKSDD